MSQGGAQGPLDAERDAHAAADAQRGEALARGFGGVHGVHEVHQDATPAGADGVPDGNGPPVHIHLTSTGCQG